MQSSFYSMQQQWHDLSLVSPTSWWKFVNNGALRVKTHTGYLKLVHWGLGRWKAFLDCLKLVHTDARHRCPQLGTLHEWTKVWHGHAGVDTCSSLWLLVPPRYTEQVDQVEVSQLIASNTRMRTAYWWVGPRNAVRDRVSLSLSNAVVSAKSPF